MARTTPWTRECTRIRRRSAASWALVIHTKRNGEISESASGKKKEELERLRQQASAIDGPDRAIVSVLVRKEGWDVRSVTIIVGLRAYSAKSNSSFPRKRESRTWTPACAGMTKGN